MAASDSSSNSGIGLSPEEVDEQAPSDEQVLAHLEEQATPEAAAEDLDQDLPSRAELFQAVQAQQEQMEQMQAMIEDQAERIDHLERKVDDVEFEATTVQEVAESLKEGKIGGEAGAEFIQQFIETPEHTSLVDARATNLFLTIIRENRVGTPVTSSDVVQWFPDFQDSANPSVQAKRVMERLVERREDGFYLGEIELKKHRGKNCIWMAE